MSEASPPDRPAAVRLIFEYEGDQVRLVAQQRVDVAVPGLDLDVSPMPRLDIVAGARPTRR